MRGENAHCWPEPDKGGAFLRMPLGLGAEPEPDSERLGVGGAATAGEGVEDKFVFTVM